MCNSKILLQLHYRNDIHLKNLVANFFFLEIKLLLYCFTADIILAELINDIALYGNLLDFVCNLCETSMQI